MTGPESGPGDGPAGPGGPGNHQGPPRNLYEALVMGYRFLSDRQQGRGGGTGGKTAERRPGCDPADGHPDRRGRRSRRAPGPAERGRPSVDLLTLVRRIGLLGRLLDTSARAARPRPRRRRCVPGHLLRQHLPRASVVTPHPDVRASRATTTCSSWCRCRTGPPAAGCWVSRCSWPSSSPWAPGTRGSRCCCSPTESASATRTRSSTRTRRSTCSSCRSRARS